MYIAALKYNHPVAGTEITDIFSLSTPVRSKAEKSILVLKLI